MLCAEVEHTTTTRILERITYQYGVGDSCVVALIIELGAASVGALSAGAMAMHH
jgi:hypothetical protein